MNYSSSRSCPMPGRECPSRAALRREASCGCSDRVEDTNIYVHADALPLAMAYVPCQRFGSTFNLCKALQMGTIFPELCKPFCGRRGICR